MASFQLTYGKHGQVQFQSLSELFFTIGYLTKEGFFELKWERNSEQNAWGNEGRIHVLRTSESYPNALNAAHTRGVGSVLHRVNCNDFFQLLDQIGFEPNTKVQNIQEIRQNIPNEFKGDFDAGQRAP